MNQQQKTEIKGELLMKAFSEFCRDEADRAKVKKGQRDQFLVSCVQRMAVLVAKVEAAGIKP
jgi:hypothetical protein